VFDAVLQFLNGPGDAVANRSRIDPAFTPGDDDRAFSHPGARPVKSLKMVLAVKAIGPVGRSLGVAALLLLAGCATGGYGPGAGYPGQQGYPGQAYPDDVRGSQALTGTVDGVDLNGQRLLLIAQSSQYGGGSRMEVYFDRNTRLYYQGRAQAIDGLERGDVVRIDAVQSGGRLWARAIEVVQNVRDRQGGGQYGNELRGAIGYVDVRARVIELDGGAYGGSSSGNRARVRYDERTLVDYQGRGYRPEDLERGDEVRIQARQVGNELLAERIWVERSARGR
jgi:hypothetical protein